MSLRRKIYYAFALAVVAVLLVLPATGWLARNQLFLFNPTAQSLMHSLFNHQQTYGLPTNSTIQQMAQTKPDDATIQFAAALQGGSKEALERLPALEERFPSDPRFLAAELRFWTANGSTIHVGHDEEIRLLETPEKRAEKQDAPPPYTPNTKDLARFDQVAAKGEELEPQNAYFFAMRALGYWSANRDAEAMAAWRLAGEKSEWNDHSMDEVTAKWDLLRRVNGGNEVGFLSRTASAAAILFPHYGPLRAAARLAEARAIQSELTGDRETGFTLRQANRRIGQTLENSGQFYIGNLVGIAIVHLSSGRPGGAEAPTMASPATEEVRKQAKALRQKTYVAYLNEIGHADEAEAFVRAASAGDAMREIGKSGMPQSYMGMGDNTFRLLTCWYSDALLVAGTLFALAFGAIFGLVFKLSPRLQKNEPLQASAKWGLIAGLFLPAIAGVTAWALTSSGNEMIVTIFLPLALLITLIALPLLYRLTGRQIGHGLLVLLATLGGLSLIIGAGMIGGCLFGGPLSMISLLQGVAVSDDGAATSDAARQFWTIILPVVVASLMVSLPLLLLLVFAICSRIIRVPVAAGVTRGMRAMAVPLAVLLLLGWCGSLILTLRHENTALHELHRFTQVGELQMYDELQGKPMPKP